MEFRLHERIIASETRAIYYWKHGDPAWVSAVPFTADGLHGENALLLRRGEDALDALQDMEFAWIHEDYERYHGP